MAAVGFHVGNENSYVSALISGGIEILDNEYNVPATQSYVAFSESSRSVGYAAKNNVVRNLVNTVFGFKTLLGLKTTDPDARKNLEHSPHRIAQLSDGGFGYKVSYLSDYVEFSVTQVMAMMLAQLKLTAEDRLKRTVRDCVITVPVYYTDAQRRAMLDAAEVADLNPLKLMNESSAVPLAYGFYRSVISGDPLHVIFFDIGHTATTVSSCAFSDRKLTVLGTVWDSVGGKDFDNCLVKHFADVFRKEYNIDAASDGEALMVLTLACEALKRKMSSNSMEINLNLERFMGVENVQGRMRRSHFEILSAPILSRIEKTIQSILTKTSLNVDDIHSVEVVGGSTRMPAINRLISKIFGREPKLTLNRHAAVARGSALQCAILSPDVAARAYAIVDSPSYDIKVTWKNMQSEVEELDVFVETDRIPALKAITFPMSRPFTLDAIQVNRSTSRRIKIGSFRFGDFPERLHGSFSEVQADVRLDIHGIFTVVSAKLFVGSKESVVSILPAEDEGQDTQAEERLVNPDEVSKKSSRKGRTFKLSVVDDVPGLSEETLVSYIETEKQMYSRYLVEKEKADSRNAMDDHVCDLQSSINNEFKAFVQDANRNKLLQFLKKQETWTYDSESRAFSKKVKVRGRTLVQPTFRRYKEWEQVPRMVEEFQESLQSALDQIEEVATAEKFYYPCEGSRKFQKIYCEAGYLYNRYDSSFPTQRKCQEVIATTEYLRKCLSELQRDFPKHYGDLKNNNREAGDNLDTGNSGMDEHVSMDCHGTPNHTQDL